MKVYFAHPISSYGTKEEAEIIRTLQSKGMTVVNPNDKMHRDELEKIRARYADRNESSRVIMEYFVSVCDACDGCAVMPFPEGSFGAGVVKEAQSFFDKGRQVQVVKIDKGQVSLQGITSFNGLKCLDVESTRAMLTKLRPDYRTNPKL